MLPNLEIVAYDPAWPRAFEAERARIAAALGDLALGIDHNGSTAVPGLASKPIIDIQISVTALQPLEPLIAPLRTLGYTHIPHADDAFCPFLHRPATWPHTYHIHYVLAGGEEERRTLAFRDYLRAHPEARDAYAHLKRQLAPNFCPDQSEAYAAAKSTFIDSIIAKAQDQVAKDH